MSSRSSTDHNAAPEVGSGGEVDNQRPGVGSPNAFKTLLGKPPALTAADVQGRQAHY